MRGKKEYPKMIYKHGVVNQVQGDYCVVQDYYEHMKVLEIWGDKRPDDVAKLAKTVKNDIEDTKTLVADSVETTEEKPKRVRRKKKG